MPDLLQLDSARAWLRVPLSPGPVQLVADAPAPVQPLSSSPPRICIVSGALGAVLLARAGAAVRINGRPLAGRVSVVRLEDRDEIFLGESTRLFLSTERLAEIVSFPGIAGPCICARCKTEIVRGQPAVACPNCGQWAHQSDDLPCFHYPKTETSACCQQSNAPDAGFRFNPDDL